MRAYLDSSALLKLVIEEAESSALRTYLGDGEQLVSSRLAEIEASRAIRRLNVPRQPELDALVAKVAFSEIDPTVSSAAGRIQPTTLRMLDAIHLATALELRGELDAFITYDARLAEAARGHRLPVVSPA